jgi:zinc transport system ATP-binding protein
MTTAVSFRNVVFFYEYYPVLVDISFETKENDFVGIIGPNGGGKTTLLKLVAGLLNPSSGSITVFGEKPSKSSKIIGYVPQFLNIDKHFPITAEQVVGMGLNSSSKLFKRSIPGDREAVQGAMKTVSIENIAKKYFGDLSLGQRQRCLIARALVSEPKLLLLDEPTASVDSAVEKDIYEIFHSLNEKMTILLVSHDLGFVSSYVKNVFCINRTLACHNLNDISVDKIVRDTYHSNVRMISHECGL